MPNKAKSQEDILREALREILDRTNKEKARDPHAAIAGGILEIHDIANTALAEFDRTPKGGHGDATMREALEEARKFIAMNKYGYFESRLLPKIDAALTAPPRNCDVGTSVEQYGRWSDFCIGHYNSAYAALGNDPCNDCPLRDCDANGGSRGCQLAWAQMPFAPAE